VLFTTVIVSSIFVILSSTPAFAYLDAGSASMILQALVGAVVVGLVSFRHYLLKFKDFIFGKKPDAAPDSTPDE